MSEYARIPVSKPDLGGNEEAYVLDAIRSSWISSTGPYVERFEREFATVCGARGAVSVVNGTAALHLALVALGVGPGDEVIVPSLTFVAPVAAIRYVGATPVFADVERHSWCIDPADVGSAITPRTRAVIAVHLYGHPARVDRLRSYCDAYRPSSRPIWIIEDAAEAHGAQLLGKPVGSLGDLATFSFYGNKIITSGEGGAVVDPTGEHLDTLRLLRGQGMDPERRYHHPVVGYNYRLTNVACALLCAQLERMESLVAARRRVCERYREQLGNAVRMQPDGTMYGGVARPAPWLVAIDCGSEAKRVAIEEMLLRADVDTRPFFEPAHTMPPYEQFATRPLPQTERLDRHGLCLPTYPTLTNDRIDMIAECVKRTCGS